MGKAQLSIEELHDRVEVVEPGIVLFREPPGGDVDNFRVIVARVAELGAPFGDFVVLIDLADATRPGPKLVEELLEVARTVGIHWCAIGSPNRFMQAVARFVMSRLVKLPATYHASYEDALEHARDVLRLRGAREA